MRAFFNKCFAHKFVRFVFAGGVSVLFNLCARAIFSLFFSYQIAIVLAYVIGMATAWFLMRILVFQTTKQRADGEIMRFLLVNIIGLAQVSVISSLLVGRVDKMVNNIATSEALAHLLGLISIVFTSYILHSKFTYSSGPTEKKR